MTILPYDIRLLESERMSDNTDGGGRRTARVIPDGVAGNIFPKVSRVDSVYGRVNLRKIYPHINTASLDVYAGAHIIITDAPDNDRIGVLAFSTGSDFDLRASARDRIESYVISGPESRMVLYGRQLKGSQAILAYQRLEEPLPEIGEVYAISTEVGGVTTSQQFVRVQDVAHEVRTFTDEGGDFQRRVITLKIGSPLRYEFMGLAAPSRFSNAITSAAGKLRTTTVADAARYFGIQPLTAAVASGALELTVASVYAPIVPTTQRETALSLASIAGATAVIPAANTPLPEIYMPNALGAVSANTLYLPGPIVPGSLKLSLINFGVNSPTYTIGADGILPAMTAGDFTTTGGMVSYEAGTIYITHPVTVGVHVFATYTPGASVSQPAHTKALPITLATRGTVYSVPLLPIPAPGTLIVDYRALGKWYRLYDNGMGELVGGDAAYGTGTVDYVTGGATITLGALPDVGSSVLLSWGSPVHYEVHTADAAGPYQDFLLEHLPAKPGTVVPSYTADGVTYTLADDGVGGLSGGGATGTIDYFTGQGRITYAARLPDFDSTLTIAYTQSVIDPDQSAGTTTTDATLRRAVTVAPTSPTSMALGMGVVPGTPLATNVPCVAPDGSTLYATLRCNDDGSVSIQGGTYDGAIGAYFRLTQAAIGTVVGSIDNATGAITLSGAADFTAMVWGAGYWVATTTASVPIRFKIGSTATFWLTPGKTLLNAAGGGTVEVDTSGLVTINTAQTLTAPIESAAPVRVDLTATASSQVVAGSVMFTMAGKTFIERNGTLYCDMLPNGSATPAGSIDYASGIATPTLWVSGAAPGLAVHACLVKFGDFLVTSAFFRTAGSPLRPASTYVQVAAEDGTLVTAAADLSGNIAGSMALGAVEQSMGVVALRFGEYVLAAGNELEPWYDPAEIVGANVWKPRAVQPQTLRYSAVVISNLPLDAEILGLDPVRLPSDGRVPIFRPADVTVIHHTDIYNAETPAADSVINVGRTDLAALWLEDGDKKKLATTMYVADLAAGTATMAADLDLTGYVPPIAAKHRIEEMVMLSDVQINGQVSLSAPLLRDFPAGSYLSGALLYGDLQARATNLFDQQTWTGVWQSTAIGDGATAQYNDVDHPVEVLNNGAVTERWRLIFTTTSSFQVIGENLGVIGTGTTGADLQPVNPLTGLPYFTLYAAGWGMGWAVGNNLRFDTIAAAPPTWLVRTVLPGAALAGDSFDAQLRGDVD